MKTLYQDSAYLEILDRVQALTPASQRQWGKMNVAQMLAHCTQPLEVVLDRLHIPRVLIGRILGPLMKKGYVSDKPFGRNDPTAKEFLIKDERDFSIEKAKLEKLIKEFHDGGQEKCTSQPHAFFGKLSKEEWGIVMYKHLDHHLRQFGA